MHPGDEVIVLEPCYDSYVPAIELSGGVPVVVSLRFPDYSVDWDAVRARDHAADAAADLNTPHNPTGAVLGADDIAALAALVDGTDILDRQRRGLRAHHLRRRCGTRAWRAHPELAARSFVVGSFGKTYHATGWKIGYAVAPAALTAEFRKVHQFVTFSTNTPVQHAHRRVPRRRGAGLRELAPFFQAKRDLFLRLMDGSRFRPLPCRGSYFQLMDYSAITDEARRRLRDPPDQGARRRVDPDVAVPVSQRRRRRSCASASRRRTRRSSRGGTAAGYLNARKTFTGGWEEGRSTDG